jgi:hypothetical protein
MLIVGIAALIALAGCTIPVTVTLDPVEIVIESDSGDVVEKVVEIPAEARRDNLTYTSVSVEYTVTGADSIAVSGIAYISDDTVADDTRNSDDEIIFNDDVVAGGEVSGTIASNLAVEILNGDQTAFVVGAEGFSVQLTASEQVVVTVVATVNAEVALVQ